MADEIAIEPATIADLDAIHRLEKACFPSPWRREFFESELHSSARLNLVVRRGRKLIGYLFAMYLFDEMHVNKIAVAESERRQGIALELMNQCTVFANKNSVTS